MDFRSFACFIKFAGALLLCGGIKQQKGEKGREKGVFFPYAFNKVGGVGGADETHKEPNLRKLIKAQGVDRILSFWVIITFEIKDQINWKLYTDTTN